MGQKANIKTLRNLKQHTTTILNSNNLKRRFNELNFKKHLVHLFFKKKILVTNLTINSSNNYLFLNLKVFFCSSAIAFFKKKIKKPDAKYFNIKQKNYKEFLNLFERQFNTKRLISNIETLNYKISKKIIKYIYFKNKRFTNSLFSRRQQLFYDILKITSLLCENLVLPDVLLKLLVLNFKILPKRKHSLFIRFFKNLFNTIIQELPKRKIKICLKGVKFLINGKISGKTRSSSNLMIIGNIPTQSISKNINYSFSFANTVYGVFGFKLWTYID